MLSPQIIASWQALPGGVVPETHLFTVCKHPLGQRRMLLNTVHMLHAESLIGLFNIAQL
jgi:hypothetical protein